MIGAGGALQGAAPLLDLFFPVALGGEQTGHPRSLFLGLAPVVPVFTGLVLRRCTADLSCGLPCSPGPSRCTFLGPGALSAAHCSRPRSAGPCASLCSALSPAAVGLQPNAYNHTLEKKNIYKIYTRFLKKKKAAVGQAVSSASPVCVLVRKSRELALALGLGKENRRPASTAAVLAIFYCSS